MTKSTPVVAAFYVDPRRDPVPVSLRILDDPRFRGLMFVLEFHGDDLFSYTVRPEVVVEFAGDGSDAVAVKPAAGTALPNASVLRQVPIDHLRRVALASIAHARGKGPHPGTAEDREDLDGLMDDYFANPPTEREIKLARLAQKWVGLLDRRSPTKALKEQENYTRDYIDQMLKEARDLGLLSPATRGKASGYLMPRALEILKQVED